nr:DEAD/DEAH box helicase [Anaerolineae bacterium]
MLNFLADLRNDADFMRDVSAWERAPEVAARHAPFPARLHERVVAALQKRGIEQLYSHQAAAIEAVLMGQHTVIAASAAGGKSLCFHAPIADALLRDPNARALCLFPTKALTQDQLVSLNALLADVPTNKAPSSKSKLVYCYDGDAPQGQRADIRRDARVILSNADMLHIGILPHHTRWAAFFKHLRYVVIDEMHMYRGVFGSHVANVIRRLRRLCQFYGSRPVFILASATIGNAREHAERLIEAPVTLIPDSDDGSPHGEQHVIIVNPPIIPDQAAQGLRRSSLLIARDIAARLIAAGAQTICFARSRQDTELLLGCLLYTS